MTWENADFDALTFCICTDIYDEIMDWTALIVLKEL